MVCCSPFFDSALTIAQHYPLSIHLWCIGWSLNMLLLAASYPTYCKSTPYLCSILTLHHTTGQQLVVQNMSLQTDSTDLLGGFKPVQLRFIAEVNGLYQFSVRITFSGTRVDYLLSTISTVAPRVEYCCNIMFVYVHMKRKFIDSPRSVLIQIVTILSVFKRMDIYV